MAAYSAWQRRKLIEEWEHKKVLHITAMYANTNMDMEENNRPEKIKLTEESYDYVIETIRGNITPEKQREMTEQEHDFMDAAKRGQALIAPPAMPGEETISRMGEL